MRGPPGNHRHRIPALLSRRPALHPLRGERQTPPSPAEVGEGSSGRGLSPTQAAWRHQNDSLPPSPLPFVTISCTLETPCPTSIPLPPCSPASSDSSPPSHPGAAPACSPPCVGTGRRPAASVRDPSAPTPRHVRAPSLFSAVLPPPRSPNLRRQPAKKSGPSYLSPARPLWGRAGER